MKAGEKVKNALDIALNVMRKTPHASLGTSAFELHYGREPNSEISNLLKLDTLKTITNNCFSAKLDTLQVYSFHGAGGASDQLSMKQKKVSKGLSNYPFQFLEKKVNKRKLDSAYSDKLQTAISCTKHSVTTADNKILHRKHIRKPISEFSQEQINRGTGLRGSDSQFIKSPTREAISDSDSETSHPTKPQMDTTQITEGTQFRDSQTTPNARTSSEEWIIRKRIPEPNPKQTETWLPYRLNRHPWPVNCDNRQHDRQRYRRVIKDAREADKELCIEDTNDDVSQ